MRPLGIVGSLAQESIRSSMVIGHLLAHVIGFGGASINVDERRAFCRIAHHDEMPRLAQQTGWRLHRDLDALFDNLLFYRSGEIEALAHYAR